ncbi:beta-lactamase family protein [Roseomonas hellenica]|nr:beta-lactamase family protein [Plastoroseomonas hellenica]
MGSLRRRDDCGCNQPARHRGGRDSFQISAQGDRQAAVRSALSGQQYGLGWWVGEAAGQGVNFAWGYGGQMLYVLPQLGLTVVMTSETDRPRVPVPGQVFSRHALLANGILPAFTR